jgi:hypothetical protein
MRNSVAIEVLNKDMLYLMKAYQATLKNTESLTASIGLLEQTSVLVDIFCCRNRPISTREDKRFDVLEYFKVWENAIEDCYVCVIEKPDDSGDKNRYQLGSPGIARICSMERTA